MTVTADIALAPEDRQRADLYNFLGVLLASPPDELLLEQVKGLSGDQTPLGEAITTLAKLARVTKPKMAAREFNALFIGMSRGELLPYASYYMTGFLNEKPLALLRQDMAKHGLARSEKVFEPEDNIASLMEMMGAMIAGRFDQPIPLDAQRAFFNRHIAPWARLFFSDLEAAKASVFYAPVGTVGRIFIEIEAEAFRLAGEA
ncbi:TorD/DmsD family molecular chaperone [Yoonia litorea]|uniref:Chaperone TorD involved in molybdoenzyme TorA maturation n=1 Tax=Yoonia litorea TaxID=1123755 RepID=A0A1I6MW73_9RHOB|nr:molecular chaperone TorD family protein [Yoonia litorea]SFS19965.1 chaperone TorD involved in molybdoenzyme TorA maturation [Yoonia litorea]